MTAKTDRLLGGLEYLVTNSSDRHKTENLAQKAIEGAWPLSAEEFALVDKALTERLDKTTGDERVLWGRVRAILADVRNAHSPP
jgi:hypothetical protein